MYSSEGIGSGLVGLIVSGTRAEAEEGAWCVFPPVHTPTNAAVPLWGRARKAVPGTLTAAAGAVVPVVRKTGCLVTTAVVGRGG